MSTMHTRATPLRIGLIGFGRIARDVHAPALRRLPGVRLSAVAEPDLSARAAARGLGGGVAVYAELSELLQADVDAVIVCAPPHAHAACALGALAAGKPVYVEKPLADRVEDARSMIAARERAGVVGMVGFNYRFNPVFAALREALARGAAGAACFVRSSFCTPRRAGPEWRRGRGGSALLDLASHHADLWRWLFDAEVAEVSARSMSRFAEHDTAVVQARLGDGLPVSATFSSAGLDEDTIDVVGDAGRLRANRYAGRLEFTPARAGLAHELVASGAAVAARARRWLARGVEPSHATALAAFVTSIHSGAPAGPTFEDGLRSLEVVVAAERSIATGRTIEIADV